MSYSSRIADSLVRGEYNPEAIGYKCMLLTGLPSVPITREDIQDFEISGLGYPSGGINVTAILPGDGILIKPIVFPFMELEGCSHFAIYTSNSGDARDDKILLIDQINLGDIDSSVNLNITVSPITITT